MQQPFERTVLDNELYQACRLCNWRKVIILLPLRTHITIGQLLVACSSQNFLIWDMLVPLLSTTDTSSLYYHETYGDMPLLHHYCYSYIDSQYYDSIILKKKIIQLCDAGADMNQLDPKGRSILSILVKTHQLELVHWCITKGADYRIGHLLLHASNWITEAQYTAITLERKRRLEQELNQMVWDVVPHWLLCLRPYSNKGMIQYLVSLGLDVNEQDNNGVTPFFAACSGYGYMEHVQCLLDAGVQFCSTKEGVSVLDWIDRHTHNDLLRKMVRDYQQRMYTEWKKQLQDSIFPISMIENGILPYVMGSIE